VGRLELHAAIFPDAQHDPLPRGDAAKDDAKRANVSYCTVSHHDCHSSWPASGESYRETRLVFNKTT